MTGFNALRARQRGEGAAGREDGGGEGRRGKADREREGGDGDRRRGV